MADNTKTMSSRKKPVSQRRVAIVLASLVGTLTLSAGALLLMENGPFGATPMPAFSVSRADIRALIQPEAPLQSGAWRFIIIYESGDLEASASSLAEGRARGGVSAGPEKAARPSANFHFVVDAASSKRGALDGELEVSGSWKRQDPGTPYAGWPDPSYYNTKSYKNAIGVCVAGDVAQRPYSEAQFRSLVQLARELQQQCQIRKEAILFQWELDPNALHATPAQRAFADEFRRALD